MATEAALKALSNSQLASGAEIPASKHRTVNDAIIEELFDAQSRGNVLSGVQAALAIAAGDKVLVIRSGQAYLLDADEFGFIDTLAGLTDVNIPTPSNDQILAYDFGTSKWVAKDLSAISTGGDITGSGTTNAIPKFTSGTNIGDSNITDDGSNITFGINSSFTGTVTANNTIFIEGTNNLISFNSSYFIFRSGSSRGIKLETNAGSTVAIQIESNGDTELAGGLTIQSGTVGGYLDTSLGTNPTTLDVDNARTLHIQAAEFTANTTLALSNVSNLFDFTMQLTNTNANVLTFAGITVYFKSDDLPTGVTFASNALTFPADTAIKYNIVGVKFDGSIFDCKIEIR